MRHVLLWFETQLNLCEDCFQTNGAYARNHSDSRRIVETNMLVCSSLSFEEAAMTEPLACVSRTGMRLS